MGHIAFKFVKWDVPELATLKDSKVYIANTTSVCRGGDLVGNRQAMTLHIRMT